MSKVVRLPGVIPEGEIRVWWGDGDAGRDLYVHGPGRLRRWAMAILDGRRLRLRSDVQMADAYDLERRYLERERSPIEELEAAGFDPETLVLSIRRKGMPAPDVPVADDILKRLEEAQDALATLKDTLGAIEETKGLYVIDEGEHEAVFDALGTAQASVAHALSMASGHASEADGDVPVEDVVPDADQGATGAVRTGGVDFEKVVVLSWQDQRSDDEPEEAPYFHLMDKDRMVGEVYGRGDGFRWHCKVSDWRGVEETLQEAKDNLVMDYCSNYANAARDLVRRSEAATAP